MPYSLPRLKYFFFLKNNFIYLFLAVLGLCYCTGFSRVAVSWDCSLVVVLGLLTAGAFLEARRLSSCGAWAQYLRHLGLVAPKHVGT